MPIRQAARADGGMEMETNRKIVFRIGRQCSAAGRQEDVFAVELVAVRRKRYEALVNDAETFGVAVVGCTYHGRPEFIVAGDRHVAGTVDDRNTEHASERRRIEKTTR